MYAAVGKESTVEQREIRRPVNSWLRQQESYPGARHGPSMQQCMYYKAREILKEARKHKNGGYRNILDRWNNDDKHHKSWSDIGWTEERIVTMKSHWKTTLALQQKKKSERDIKETFYECRRYSRGPLNQRSDFREAKQTCKRLHHEYTAITEVVSGNKPFSPGRQVRQRLDSTV